MYNISKYHGCGNNFVIMQEAELAEQLGVPCGEESAGAYAKFAAGVCDESVASAQTALSVVRTEPVLEMVFPQQRRQQSTDVRQRHPLFRPLLQGSQDPHG